MTEQEKQLVLVKHFEETQKSVQAGNYQRALALLHIFAFAEHGKTVSVFKVIQSLYAAIAAKLRVSTLARSPGGKIRLGYLTEGFDYTQAPIMNLLNFVRYADYGKFDITIYSRISPYEGRGFHLEKYPEGIKRFQEAGAKVFHATAGTSNLDRVKLLYARMLGDNLDILDSYVMYTIPACHLLCAMRPAPIVIKECWQQPEYLDFPDLTIHATETTLREDTGQCELLSWQWPRPRERKKYTREELGLPTDRPCIAVIGRSGKFSSEFYDHLHRAVLSCFPQKPVIGILGETGESTDIVRFLGFQEDIVDVLRVFDFCVDTFPLGGGKALADATFAGLPVVTFEGPEQGKFLVEEWTMPEIPANQLLTMPRWDYLEWEAKVRRLATDKDFLRKNAEYAQKRAIELGDFTGYMRRREAIYERLYNQIIG